MAETQLAVTMGLLHAAGWPCCCTHWVLYAWPVMIWVVLRLRPLLGDAACFRQGAACAAVNTSLLSHMCALVCCCTGHCKTVEFTFDMREDTADCIAKEMMDDLSLSEDEAAKIAKKIKEEISRLVSTYRGMHTQFSGRWCP